VPDWLRRYLQPREGWLSAVLLMVMLLSLCWAVQRTGWLTQTEYLVPIAFYAVFLGIVLGLSSLSLVAVVPISAVVGAGLVLWTVGGEYFSRLPFGMQLATLRTDAIDWIRILTDRGFAPQLTPYALALGMLLWATAFMAAYAIYRHHRVLDAILLVGAGLLANMLATLTNLFGYLVLFMLAALLLWLRAALVGREEGWHRRRVNENVEVPPAIMRSGISFIAGSLILAWVLTGVAVAAPLTEVWRNLDVFWGDVRDQMEVVLGGLNNGESRFHGTNFGPNFSISGEWTSSDEPVLTVASRQPLYLRAWTYDVYTGRGWSQSAGHDRTVEASQPIFPGYTPERPTQNDAFTVQEIGIQLQRPSGRVLLSTGYPISISAPVLLTESANEPFLGALKATTSIPAGSSYSLRAATSNATKTQLAAAGVRYPQEVIDHYLGLGGVTQRTIDLAHQIAEQANANNPFTQAEALVAYFRTNAAFSYQTTAPLPADPTRDMVDFFLFDPEGQVGYCEHYASSMVVLARALGIPARISVGYAPGQRLDTLRGDDGRPTTLWQVREANAHAWAELYFPGYGWQIFEATKAIRPPNRVNGGPLPSGGAQGGGPTRSPPPIDTLVPGEVNSIPSAVPLPDQGTGGNRGEERNGNILVVLGIVGLLLLAAAWRWRRARLALRFLSPGDRQWMRLALAAERAGVGQRPSETIYEYAGWLEEQIPTRREDIRTIADGKVVQTYSGRRISGAAVRAMEAAWKHLQLPMVWLAIRRRLRTLVRDR
jgi:transglutaminase-like putative cysteine protease